MNKILEETSVKKALGIKADIKSLPSKSLIEAAVLRPSDNPADLSLLSHTKLQLDGASYLLLATKDKRLQPRKRL